VSVPVLDATFLIDLKRHPDRVSAVLERIVQEEDPLVVPVQAAIEYSCGEADPGAAMRALEAAYDLAPCEGPIAIEAARIARAIITTKRRVPWADLQVAATARQLGMYVVSRNPRDLRDALGARVWDYAREPEPPA
jgi:predicted nucleic acid-binding protein